MSLINRITKHERHNAWRRFKHAKEEGKTFDHRLDKLRMEYNISGVSVECGYEPKAFVAFFQNPEYTKPTSYHMMFRSEHIEMYADFCDLMKNATNAFGRYYYYDDLYCEKFTLSALGGRHPIDFHGLGGQYDLRRNEKEEDCMDLIREQLKKVREHCDMSFRHVDENIWVCASFRYISGDHNDEGMFFETTIEAYFPINELSDVEQISDLRNENSRKILEHVVLESGAELNIPGYEKAGGCGCIFKPFEDYSIDDGNFNYISVDFVDPPKCTITCKGIMQYSQVRAAVNEVRLCRVDMNVPTYREPSSIGENDYHGYKVDYIHRFKTKFNNVGVVYRREGRNPPELKDIDWSYEMKII